MGTALDSVLALKAERDALRDALRDVLEKCVNAPGWDWEAIQRAERLVYPSRSASSRTEKT